MVTGPKTVSNKLSVTLFLRVEERNGRSTVRLHADCALASRTKKTLTAVAGALLPDPLSNAVACAPHWSTAFNELGVVAGLLGGEKLGLSIGAPR